MSRVLDQKLKKVLELQTDSPEMTASLEALSTCYRGNTIEARRALRSDLEQESLRIASSFVDAFSPLEDLFSGLSDSIDQLHQGCTAVRDRLEATETRTAQFLTRAEELRTKRDRLDRRTELVSSFLERFQLSEEEIDTLQTHPIDADDGKPFFAALQRVESIRGESKELISSAHQSAGVEILENMAKHQEEAYQRLFTWLQEQCQRLATDAAQTETPEVDIRPVLRQSLKVLANRPSYHRHCQDCVVSTRRAALVGRFIAALTRGGPGGLPRPIEAHAHSPERYIGDMLAWIHQAIATEREVLVGLFGTPDAAPPSRSSTSSSNLGSAESKSEPLGEEKRSFTTADDGDNDDDDNSPSNPTELLTRVFDGVVRPLTARIDHVLQAQSGVVLLFKLTDVISFYSTTIGTLLPSNVGLCKALNSSKDIGTKRFFDLVRHQGTVLAQSVGSYPADLVPSRAVADALNRLSEILEVYSRSMVPGPEREEGFAPVLAAFLEPLLHICRQSAEGLSLCDTAVYMLNNVTAMQTVLMPFDFTASWVERLAAELQQWEDALVREEATTVLGRVGLTPKLRAIESHDGSTPLSTVEGLGAEALGDALKALYASLFSPVMPTFDRLTSPRLRERARRGTSQAIAAAYDTVYAAMVDDANAYGAEAVPTHAPSVIRTLLDL